VWVKPEILHGVTGFETKSASGEWVSILGRSPERATVTPWDGLPRTRPRAGGFNEA
jgi:hypothetical protein